MKNNLEFAYELLHSGRIECINYSVIDCEVRVVYGDGGAALNMDIDDMRRYLKLCKLDGIVINDSEIG
jgi:hypothetical protein